MRRILLGLCLAAGLASISVPASAQVLASSSFTTGTDGWLLGDFFLPLWLDPGGVMFWQASGGNPDGYIGTTRDARAPSFVEGFLAPSSFLGNQSAALGGNLTFFTRANMGADPGNFPMVLISDGTTMLQFRAPAPVGTGWNQYVTPFLAQSGWEVATLFNYAIPGAPATTAQLQAVLGNLSFMSIQADDRGGEDLTDLDEVVLSARTTVTPEPAAIWLLGSGLGVVGGLLSRRRRKA